MGISIIQQKISSGLNFLSNLNTSHSGWYWEVTDPNHSEHRIYPQSQHLLSITFKRFGKYNLANDIYNATDFRNAAVDRNITSSSRFCVLDNDPCSFYLANSTQLPASFDEVALLGHYWALTGNNSGANQCATFLKSQWNQQHNVIGMDPGDASAKPPLFRIYKTALAGTLFARVGMLQDCQTTSTRLQGLQDTSGGWKTDLDSTGTLQGVPNIETTCLALICLDCSIRGRFTVITS